MGSEHSEQVIPPCKARAAKLNHFQEGLLRTVVSGLEDWLAGYAQAAPEVRRNCRAVGLRHLRGVPVQRIHGQWADQQRTEPIFIRVFLSLCSSSSSSSLVSLCLTRRESLHYMAPRPSDQL